MALFHTTVVDNQIKALDTIGSASGSIATFDTDRAERLVSCVCEVANTSVVNVILGRPTGKLDGYGINNLGVIYSVARFALLYMPVVMGEQYIINTNESTDLVYAFYTNVPVSGSTSYDGSRIIASAPTQTITAPINGYVVFRYDKTLSGEGYSGIKYTVNLGNTYTGIVDVVTGKITHGTPEQIDYANNSVEIPTLSGNNAVYSDSGNTTVKYLLTVGKAIS